MVLLGVESVAFLNLGLLLKLANLSTRPTGVKDKSTSKLKRKFKLRATSMSRKKEIAAGKFTHTREIREKLVGDG